jgi:hypothetical protein
MRRCLALSSDNRSRRRSGRAARDARVPTFNALPMRSADQSTGALCLYCRLQPSWSVMISLAGQITADLATLP